MPNEPISSLSVVTEYSTDDLMEVVDVSDSTFALTGTNKKVTIGNLFANVSQALGSGSAPTIIGFTNSELNTASRFQFDQSNYWTNIAGYPVSYTSFFGHWFFGATWTTGYTPTLPFAPGDTPAVMIVGAGRVGNPQLGLQISPDQTAHILDCYASNGTTILASIASDGTFIGNGSGLINLNASNLSLGKVPISQLPITGLTINQHVGTIVTDIESAGSVTCDLSVSDWHMVVLNNNLSLSIINPTVGQQFGLIFQQALMGGPYSISSWFNGTINWMGAPYTAPSMPITASGYLSTTFKCINSGVYLGWWTGNSNI